MTFIGLLIPKDAVLTNLGAIVGFPQSSALQCLTNLVEGTEVGMYRNSFFAAFAC
jgi:5,10-methenyltetrahydromethanopterin hydrogenase